MDRTMSKVYCDGTCKEAIDLLLEVINQACAHRDCEHSPYYLDSMALSAYADAMRFLEKQGKIKITSQGGRRVIGEFIEKEK